MTPRPLYLVAVCFHLAPARFVAALREHAAACGFALRGVVMCNHPTHPLALAPDAGSEIEVARGSNALFDFSGYFEGLARLQATHPEAAASNVLFVNDTLLTKHAARCVLRRVLSLDALLQQLRLPAIGGKLDPYRLVCLRNPWSGDAGYVSSFCFLLNARALPAMQRLPEDAAADGVLAAAPLGSAGWGSGVPAPLRELIRAHLVYAGSPILWPQARQLDAEGLRRKAACVYFESRLSGAIGAGGALVPANSGPRSSTDLFINELLARLWRALWRGGRRR